MDKDNNEVIEQEDNNQLMERIFNKNYHEIKDEDLRRVIINIPNAPGKEMIKRLLLELPQQITFLDNYILDYKQQIKDAKTTLKANKDLLEIRKSEIRRRVMGEFQKENDTYMDKTQELMKEIMNSKEQNASLKKAYLQEVSRVFKPERPTKSDLDDIANIETRHLQEEMHKLEKTISECQFEIDFLMTKKDFYNNMWVTVRAYKGVIVEEMRMLGEQ
ncbi:hypothetical protein U8V72_18020 [Priestia filamentosa]|uniref:hypothetical protein n=1 Tax=Priestia filamentosa TaxID=1402861 RepID=UPI000588EDE4